MFDFLKKIQNVTPIGSRTEWHAFAADELFTQLQSSASGLGSEEAQKRLQRFGPNELPHEEGDPAWKLLLRQFKSPLMLLMAAAVGVSYAVGNVSDTIFILVVMCSNALVGFYQEYKANESLRSLQNMVKLKARVVRGGREQETPTSELVPGDIVVLRAGDRVPADGRILESDNARVNESSLTGESKSVEKRVGVTGPETPIGDQFNMVFMGTIVEEGSLLVVVVETGVRTQYGDIVLMLEGTPEEPTPLQRTVVSLSKIIGVFISVVVGLIILEGAIAGRPFGEIFGVALALFVSAIPEGLLPAITIVLAIGMRRIVKHKGLVRRLAATETLGGVTVICTDKTGTLTEGKMEVDHILTAGAPEDMSLQAAIFASDAFIENPEASDSGIVVRGRPTEQAFLRSGIARGLRKDVLDKEHKTIDTLFFSSEYKYSASLRLNKFGQKTLYVIGAPERLLEKVTAVETSAGPSDTESEAFRNIVSEMERLTGQGFRLVACAAKPVERDVEHGQLRAEVENLILLGFIVISDPVRLDVPQAFQKTRRAGIRTVIVTGDHKTTATVIAEKIGFDLRPEEIIEGSQIEELSDPELKEKIKTVSLFARVSPRHKLRIVRSFQEQGEVVAMFGDGVNDAPALKAANIGVAVQTEVDAVREVADLVLLDGGFSTIVKAIEQGRVIFDNIKRVFLYLITQDFSQFFIFFISIALGLPLPLIAAQLLFVNLVESGLPDLALTTEEEREGLMDEPPRNPRESILNKPAKRWMISLFAISGGLAMLFYYLLLESSGSLEKTRTMLTVFLCLESLFLAFCVRSFRKPILRRDIFRNKWLTGAVLISFLMIVAAVYFEPLQRLLQTVPLSKAEWGLILSVNLFEILLVDVFKLSIFKPRLRV